MRNKKILGIVALGAVAAVGGSFAYFNQTMTAENPFNTGTYNTVMQEVFNPEDGDKWTPGSEVNKDVFVKNLGDQPVVVRVKLDESWVRKGEPKPFKEISSTTETQDSKNTEKVKAIVNVYQQSDSDGKWKSDDTVVKKTILNESNWIPGEDGWYYYKEILGPEETIQFLDKVMLSKELDLGAADYEYTYSVDFHDEKKTDIKDRKITKDTYLFEDENNVNGPKKIDLSGLAKYLNLEKGDKLTTDIKVGTAKNSGYSDANYTLTITSQTVQATKEAVEDLFKGEGETKWSKLNGLNWEFMNSESETPGLGSGDSGAGDGSEDNNSQDQQR